jgi:eukaryotic-like serine/threonine-protein kinase
LQRALQKDRAKRYQDASAMLGDLRKIKQELDISVSSRRISELQVKQAKSISWHLLGGLAAALVAPLAALIYWGPSLFPSPESFEIGSMRQVTFNGHVVLATLSPNGEMLATSVGEPGIDEAVQVRRLGGQNDEQTVVMPASARKVEGLTFSPDNQFLYVVVKGSGKEIGKLYRLPAGRPAVPEEVLEDLDGPVSFSPDGRQFAHIRFAQQETSYRNELAVADSAHPSSTRVIITKSGEEQLGKRVAWSGRGDLIACVLYRKGTDGLQDAIVDLVPIDPGKKESLVPMKGWESIG